MPETVAPQQMAGIEDTDVFCGPCFNHAMNHTGTARVAPMCGECPGYAHDRGTDWWDTPGGDPSLDGAPKDWCPHCPDGNGPDNRGTLHVRKTELQEKFNGIA